MGKGEEAGAHDRLAALAALEDGWDSYDAPALDPRAIDAAWCLLDAMNITPTNRGGVQVSWMGEAISITFRADGEPCAVWFDLDDVRSWVEMKARNGVHFGSSAHP